ELRRIDQVEVLGDLDRLAVEEDREGVLGRGGRRRRGSRLRRGRLRGRGRAHAVAPAAMRALFPTRHRLCSMWCRYSSRNLVTDESGGAMAASENTQIVMPLAIWLQMRARRSTSSTRPSPSSIRSRTLKSQGVPSRHGVHWPHDSWEKNFER